MNTINRRDFLKLTGSAGLALLLKPDMPYADAIPPNRRVLVLEMNGGNDGLNTVIPYTQGAYYDLRPTLAIPVDRVLPISNQLGFHPSLAKLQARFLQGQVAIWQGIGHPNPDLSHFAMMEYWRAGHPEGMAFTSQTGWLGRLLDKLAPAQDVLSGLSLANGVNPMLSNKSAIVAALSDPDANLPYIPWQYETLFWPLLNGLSSANAADSSLQAASKKGMRDSRLALDLIPLLAATKPAYPNTETGRLLGLAARIFSASANVRALHIPLPLDFDSHSGQASLQTKNFTELDAALDVFLQDLVSRGLSEQTLVVMVSEFGRRAAENNSLGTDHGTANNAFIIGSNVLGGVYGQQPSLTDLDADGNLKASSSYLDLLATVSEGWMGVSAGQILPSGSALNLFS